MRWKDFPRQINYFFLVLSLRAKIKNFFQQNNITIQNKFRQIYDINNIILIKYVDTRRKSIYLLLITFIIITITITKNYYWQSVTMTN